MALNTTRRLKDLALIRSPPEEVLPDLLSLGMHYHSKETLLNASHVLRELLSSHGPTFLSSNGKQLAGLSLMLTFWGTALLPGCREILPNLLDILDIMAKGGHAAPLANSGLCEALLAFSGEPVVGPTLRARIAGIAAAIVGRG